MNSHGFDLITADQSRGQRGAMGGSQGLFRRACEPLSHGFGLFGGIVLGESVKRLTSALALFEGAGGNDSAEGFERRNQDGGIARADLHCHTRLERGRNKRLARRLIAERAVKGVGRLTLSSGAQPYLGVAQRASPGFTWRE